MASTAALASLVAAAMLALFPTPAPAETRDVVAGEPAEFGMPASNPRVKPLLSAHPGDFVTICVAGCDKPRIVQTLPKPRESRVGSMRTTAADGSQAAYDSADRDAVLCVAGCSSRPGVVQRIPELPRQPAQPKVASPEQPGNEPLDRNR